jgi:hypothetical protein
MFNESHLGPNDLGQAYFDLTSIAAQGGSFKYALQGRAYKSLIVETGPDGNGNSSGSVMIYIGSAVNGRPWREVAIGGGRGGPVPATDFLTFVPTAGAQGIVAITLSTEIWGTFFKTASKITYPTLEQLSDVTITSPTNGQGLTYESGLWVNSSPSLALENLTDVAVTSPANGQTLTYESGQWVNQSSSTGATPEAIGGGGLQIANGGPGTITWSGVAGRLLVVALAKDTTNAAPTGWTLVYTFGNIQIYTRTSTGSSADNFNGSGIGNCCGFAEEFINATSVYGFASVNTTGNGGGQYLATINITKPTEYRTIADGQDTQLSGPGWTSATGNFVGGRTTTCGSRFIRNALGPVFAPHQTGNGNSFPIVNYAIG